MKTVKIVIAALMLVIINAGFSQYPSGEETALNESSSVISVYYFHFNARCATCRAIESEAELDVKLLFGDDVIFASFNLDKPDGEAKGKDLGVNSQALLVVKGDKKIDLTKEGFLYARTDPDKFKEIIEEKIRPLL